MLDRLPIVIDPVSFSEKGKRLLGTIEISELTRLSDALLDTTGVADIDISFDKEGRLSVIQGEIKANLMLGCQTCLQQLVMPIDRRFKLGVVLSIEQADRLASDCEPLILENQKISLKELVEDELLLALPDFPRHEHNCVETDEVSVYTADDNEQVNSNNPFSVLAKLKNTGD
ncbi:MAG: DUF177 domain-containing protein [Methylococcales bacterium]|nr:DUF177 domain-containing protein [Methylococcales bacterium]